jgi:hypothetical protein
MKKVSIFVAIALTVLTWIPVRAQDQKAKTEVLAKLEQMLADTDWKVTTSTGGPKGQWLLRQRKLNRLIDQLKAGQSVDPKEVDELLRQHP